MGQLARDVQFWRELGHAKVTPALCVGPWNTVAPEQHSIWEVEDKLGLQLQKAAKRKYLKERERDARSIERGRGQ